MKVGFVGTGKLGLPVSLMYSSKGHELLCYDIHPSFYEGKDPVDLLYNEEMCPNNKLPLKEWFKQNPLQNTYRHTKSMDEVVSFSDLIFIAVQTPHMEKYEGKARLTKERDDFDYTHLKKSIETVSEAATRLNKDCIVVIISTVLPGTIRREIFPILSPKIKLCYNPYFIAMGTVASDCMYPEFILLGNHNEEAADLVTKFYKSFCESPVFTTTVENAEMIKVSYNTFIGTKIAMANTIMELCHYLPNTDCDVVMDALFMSHRRLISKSYLRGGMGDGGGCHPRDNIALSWLSEKVGLQYNFYDAIMTAREKQTEFLANLVEEQWIKSSLPVVLLGESFKANTAITVGSPAVLLGAILKEKDIPFSYFDPYSRPSVTLTTDKSIFLASCAHDSFMDLRLPEGSILIDPHRKYSSCITSGVYIPVGRNTL
jgi:UDPglucose 6-dehydrogenase